MLSVYNARQAGKRVAVCCVPSWARQGTWGLCLGRPTMQPMLSAGAAPMSEAYGVGAKQALAPLTEGRAAPMGAHAKGAEPQAVTGGAPPGSQAQVTLNKNELQHLRHSRFIREASPCLSAWLARGADNQGRGNGASG